MLTDILMTTVLCILVAMLMLTIHDALKALDAYLDNEEDGDD